MDLTIVAVYTICDDLLISIGRVVIRALVLTMSRLSDPQAATGAAR